MKNLIRILTATLLLAACVSAAAPASTPPPISTTLSQEGPSPVPWCDPRVQKCTMPMAPDSSAHR
jgi:hypothetical protein